MGNKNERFTMRMEKELKTDFAEAVKPTKMSKVVHEFVKGVVAEHKSKKETPDGNP